MGRLFGTDGIRGEAGKTPLTPADVFSIGLAAGRVLRAKSSAKRNRVIAVRDTRYSGSSLLDKLSEGLRKGGVDVFDAGVLTTPAVAYLVRAHRFESGVVISASHNPPEFNGIKFFNHLGRKWPDEWEDLVEKHFFDKRPAYKKSSVPNGGQFIEASGLAADYEQFLTDSLGTDANFSGFNIVIDCANGANSKLAPTVFRRLGADVRLIGAKPNGRNINVNCGSQHTGRLVAEVQRWKSDCGIAFDGDGDRVIMVDERGAVVDGDFVVALLATYLKSRRELTNNKVVITVMANLGLKKALAKLGVQAIEVPVGDRHVSAAMHKHGAVLGGEQSGHIILGRYLPTGDGLLTAVHVVNMIRREKKPLSKLSACMKKFPQVLMNVSVKQKIPLEQLDGVQPRIERVGAELGKNGRVLVRYSGTEPLLRIMLEGPDKAKLELYGKDIASTVVKAFA